MPQSLANRAFAGAGSLRFRPDVAFEVHGGVEDADDLQGMVVSSKENDVAAFGDDAAAGEEFFAETITMGVRANRFEAGPEIPEVALLLFRAPGFESVGPDGTEVVEGGLGEDKLHAPPRTRSMKCCSDWISTD